MAINFFNSLAVGTNVLYVDTLNDRVGIGTSTPDTGTNLHVLTGTGSGQIKLSSQANTQFQFYGDGNQDINYGKPANFPDPGGSVIGQIRYSHGSNYMAFKVNNAEMVRFASNNNVGIGTISPSQKLHVSGNVTANRYYGNGSTVYYVDPNDSTTSAVLNGKVGIGTSNPISKFQVTSAGFPQVRINDETNGGESGIRFRSKGTGVDLHGDIFVEGTGAETGRMGFRIPWNGTEKMTILSSGDVGIGTTSPSNGKLQIDSASNQISIETGTSGDGRLHIGHFSNGTFIGTYGDDGGAADLIRFGTHSGDERLRIGSAGQIGIGGANYGTSGQVLTSNGSGSAPSWQDAGAGSSNWTLSGNNIYNNNSGKVGIGTTAPSNKLHVSGGSGDDIIARFEATGTGTGDYSEIHIANNNNDKLVLGSIGSNYSNSSWAGMRYVYSTAGDLGLKAIASNGNVRIYAGSSSAEHMRITSAGNAGIGTTSPTHTLHVHSDTDNDYVARFEGSTNNGSGVWTGIGIGGESNNTKSAIIFEDIGVNYSRGKLHLAVNNEQNQNNATKADARLTVSNDGNVGVGTTSPGYKLEVNGTAKADEFVSLVNASNSGITRDWTIIGTGDRGAGLQVNDISGAKYAIYAGGYDLTFGKHVSSNNTYTTAMGIYAANATDSSPYVQATHSLRAPIFYDSNDTNYYVNPASTSRIRKTNLIASGSGWDDGLNLYSNDATNKWNLLVDNGSADHLRFAFNSSEKARLQTNGALISYGQFVNSGNGFKSLNNKGMVGDYDTNGTAAKIIWTIGDSWNSLGAMYGLAYEYNGTYGHHLALRENGTTYQRLSFYSGSFFSGTVTSNTDFRAPVFYDSNNTGYYVNPASSSQFADIYYNAWLRNNRTASSSGLYWESGTPGAGWHIYPVNTTDMFIRSGSTSNGSLRLTAGNETARGYLYWDSSSNVGFLSNAAAWTFKVDNSGNTFATASHRAPIFYDSNDTNYYTDPASRSNLSTLVIGSTAANSSGYKLDIHGAVNAQNNDINYVNQLHFNANVRFYDDNNDSYLNFKYGDSNYGAIVFWNGVGTRKGFLYADSNGFGLLDSDGQWTVRSPQGGSGLELRSNDNVEFTVNDDHTLSHGSSRAPIFYDSNDTGYYLDPASTSIVNTITANDALQAYHIGIRNTSNGTKDGISLYGGATGGEPTYGIMFTGTSGSGTHGAVTGDWATYFTMNNDNSRGWIFRRVGSGNAASISGGGIGTFSNARFTGIVSNGGTTGDATVGRNHAYNTLELKGYGQEMMIGSEGAALHINYRTCNNGVSGHTPTSWYWRAGSSTSYSNHYMGLIQSSSSMRAPIFYDSSNTSYYVDPASVNVLNRVVAGTTSTSNSGSQLYVTGTTSATNPIGYFDNSWGGYGHAAYEFKNIAYGHALQFKKTTPYDGGALKFMYSSTQVGSIQIGNTSTAYLTTSDYRLKENVIELTDGIERVKQLQPKRFNFIDDEDTVDGFVAHEAQEVVPESVTGEKDGVLPNGEPVYQGIDQAKLVPLLTAALKEAITKIEDLETRIQILENQ